MSIIQPARPIVYTVGHSTLTHADLIDLLSEHDIDAVADVRSRPYSRFTPQHNRETLREALTHGGVRYVFLGDKVGGKSGDPAHYVDGKICHQRVAAGAAFQEGARRIVEGAQRMRVALLCAEKDPLMCHRSVLIAKALRERLDFRHILEDGGLESHSETEHRLIHALKITPDLFRDEAACVALAYERLGWKDDGKSGGQVHE